MKDVFFQKPETVQTHLFRWLRAIIDVKPEFRRSTCLDFEYCLDAPSDMPAGALQFFDHGDDVYGAKQMLCSREA
jgi:hypothetical protein